MIADNYNISISFLYISVFGYQKVITTWLILITYENINVFVAFTSFTSKQSHQKCFNLYMTCEGEHVLTKEEKV